MKSDKMPNIIYGDNVSLIKKIDNWKKNTEKSPTAKIGKKIPCGYSRSTIWSFNYIENKRSLYSEKGCMKKFCEFLREHAKSIINFEKKKMLPLTKK